MTPNENKKTTVLINGHKLSGVVSVVSDFSRERVVGSDGELEKPPTDMYVTIRRERNLSAPRWDGINLRGLDNFRLDIYTPFHVSVFANCQWTAFLEEIGTDNKIHETITVASLHYTMN